MSLKIQISKSGKARAKNRSAAYAVYVSKIFRVQHSMTKKFEF
jgi:hypothetical protein